jgi:hypothetical protein
MATVNDSLPNLGGDTKNAQAIAVFLDHHRR